MTAGRHGRNPTVLIIKMRIHPGEPGGHNKLDDAGVMASCGQTVAWFGGRIGMERSAVTWL